MKTLLTAAVLAVGLFGVAGSAMADKTWNSDPSTYGPVGRTGSSMIEAAPVQVAPSNEPRKAYRLYKAPKAHAKSHLRNGR